MKLILLFFLLILMKFLANTFRLLKTQSLYRRYKTKECITSRIPEIDSLFKNADTSYQTTYDERKHGYLERSMRDVAYLSDRDTYFKEVDKVFQLTIGVYRTRMKNAINPFYWLFLPVNILHSHSITPNAIIRTLISFIYWIIGVLAAYHLNAFLDTVYLHHFQQLLEKLLQEIAL